MNDDIYSGLVPYIENQFQEIDSSITTRLRKSDGQYTALRAKLGELVRMSPFIETVLDGEGEVHLTSEEHGALVEYIFTKDEAERQERLALYLAGHSDGFAYLKRIGAV